MTSRLEFEGKTVEIAIQNACKELKIEKEHLKHEIISYGSTGIFGLVGAKKARIRVILPDATESAPKEQSAPVPDATEHSKHSDEDTVINQEEIAVDINLTDLAEQGKVVLTEILTYISEDTQISMTVNGTKICYTVSGGSSGMLIGKRGQTLESLQYILEKIVNKNSETRVGIQLDVEGYLENREENLKALALKLSKKVKRTGKPVTVGHMSAHDRRIIHIALKNDKKVHTQSMGDGHAKKLVIFPKRRQNPKQKKAPEKE